MSDDDGVKVPPKSVYGGSVHGGMGERSLSADETNSRCKDYPWITRSLEHLETIRASRKLRRSKRRRVRMSNLVVKPRRRISGLPKGEYKRLVKQKSRRSRSMPSKSSNKKKSRRDESEEEMSASGSESDTQGGSESSSEEDDHKSKTPSKKKKDKKKSKKKSKSSSSKTKHKSKKKKHKEPEESDSDSDSDSDDDIKTDAAGGMTLSPMSDAGDDAWDFKVGRVKVPLGNRKSSGEKHWVDVHYNDENTSGIVRIKGVICTNPPKRKKTKAKKSGSKIRRKYLHTHVMVALPKKIINDICERLECNPPRSLVASGRDWYTINIPRDGAELYIKKSRNKMATVKPSSATLAKSLVHINGDFRLELWESAVESKSSKRRRKKAEKKKKKGKKKKKKRRDDSSSESSDSDSDDSSDSESDSEDDREWGNFTLGIALIAGGVERQKRSNVNPHPESQRSKPTSYF